METAKTKWLAYTVLVGLIPIFSRFLIWLVTKEGTIAPFAPQDLIAFGLVLHISNINEIEHLVCADRSWKILQNGVSAFFIAVYGVLFCLTLTGADTVDPQSIMISVGIIALVSLYISYCLFTRISNQQTTGQERPP